MLHAELVSNQVKYEKNNVLPILHPFFVTL